MIINGITIIGVIINFIIDYTNVMNIRKCHIEYGTILEWDLLKPDKYDGGLL